MGTRGQHRGAPDPHIPEAKRLKETTEGLAGGSRVVGVPLRGDPCLPTSRRPPLSRDQSSSGVTLVPGALACWLLPAPSCLSPTIPSTAQG